MVEKQGNKFKVAGKSGKKKKMTEKKVGRIFLLKMAEEKKIRKKVEQ